MTMKKANVEFVEFDAKDVITTSSRIIIPSGLTQVIWMSKESIDNYNAFDTNDWTLTYSQIDEQGGYHGFYAYGGGSRNFDLRTLGESGTADSLDDTKYEVKMNPGDGIMYAAILNWLVDNAKISKIY